MRSRFTILLRVLLVGAVFCAARVPVVLAGSKEINQAKLRRVKSAFMLNFAKFVKWPKESYADQESPIVIGVVGKDPFGTDLDDTVKGKTAQDRKLVIKRFSFDKEPDREEMKRAQMLYVSEGELGRWKEIQEHLGDANVLVIGETADFAVKGGMLAFVLADDRVTFHINRAAITRTKLSVSAKLYQLAPVVHNELPQESEGSREK